MAANDHPNTGIEETDLNGWRESTNAMLGRFQAHSEPFGISNVPKQLREGNKNAYMPKAISIGPRYKGARRNLMKWQKIKWHFMQSLLHRGPKRSAEKKLHECMSAISGLENEVRASYGEDLKLGWNDLANIMLSDACFLLEILIRESKDFSEKLKSRLPANPEAEVRKPEEFVTLVTDLIVLENQIPLVILHKLSEKILDDEEHVVPVETLALNLFGYFPDERFKYFVPDIASHHFLELVHSYISEDDDEELLEQAPESQHSIPINTIRSLNFQEVLNQCANCACNPDLDNINIGDNTKKTAEDTQGSQHVSDAVSNVQHLTSHAQLNRCVPILEAAGVTIKTTSMEKEQEKQGQVSNEIRGFNFDIKFSKINGTLEIPQLYITKSTEVMWRNLIAWEQGHTGFSCKHKCTWAAFFFNSLICCESDVQLLKDKEVIVDHFNMGNRKLLEFFRSIVNGVDRGKTSDSPYWEMVRALNSYYRACCLKIKRYSIILRHSWIPTAIRQIDRFVLRGYNLLIGIISIYALMQTIYAMLGYYHHSSSRLRNSGQSSPPPPYFPPPRLPPPRSPPPHSL